MGQAAVHSWHRHLYHRKTWLENPKLSSYSEKEACAQGHTHFCQGVLHLTSVSLTFAPVTNDPNELLSYYSQLFTVVF